MLVIAVNGTIVHGDFDRMVPRELYEHKLDPGNDPDVSENENVVESADPNLLEQLHAMLRKGFVPSP